MNFDAMWMKFGVWWIKQEKKSMSLGLEAHGAS
jgi:hypothetical protein